MANINDNDVHSFFFEAGQLRYETRHGWLRLMQQYENVAEHTFRASVIAFVLALMENYNSPEYVVALTVFHDLHEVRIGDTDPYQKRYLRIDEEKAIEEQTFNLSGIGQRIRELWHEMHQQCTIAAQIAKDAELLECAYSASELYWNGIKEAEMWVPPLAKRLQTKSAQRLISTILSVKPTKWWEDLSANNALSS